MKELILMLFTLRWLSPGMLQNPKSQELLESLRTKKRLPVRTDWTIQEEAGTKLYRSEKGRMGVPMQNIIAALIIAGQGITYKGKKTILLVTHDMKTIVERIDRVLCVDHIGTEHQRIGDHRPERRRRI